MDQVMKIDIGIDPDSNKSGIAIYRDGGLSELVCLDAGKLFKTLEMLSLCEGKATVHIEDVCSISGVFRQRLKRGESLNSMLMKAQNVGMCKQVQKMVEQMCKGLEIPVKKYKPSKAWKDTKEVKIFQLATGWKKSGNADSRSAAYFGYIGSR